MVPGVCRDGGVVSTPGCYVVPVVSCGSPSVVTVFDLGSLVHDGSVGYR